jgi:hypothetical protein
MSEIIIEVPLLAPSLNGPNGLIRMHFGEYKKHKDKWTWWIKKSALGKKAPEPCTIHMERYYSKQPLDWDNFFSCFKVPGDSLRAAGIISDDNPKCVVGITGEQIKVGKIKDEKTVIIIKAVEP